MPTERQWYCPPLEIKMSKELSNQLALLPTMSKAQSLALWTQVLRIPPPRKVRRDLFIRILAYQMQEQAFGGLNPATRKRLSELARKFQTNPHAELSDAPR